MLRLYQSNRLEALAEALAQLTCAAPLPPLEPETIVVPSSELGRWLSFSLAERTGIAANLRLEFAAGFIWKLIRALVATVPEASPFEPEVLQWRLASLLAVQRPEGPVRRYLSAGSSIKRYDLARAAATAFDRYIVYRTDWIEAWARGKSVGLGEDEPWQAGLWREVAASLPTAMRAHPSEVFFAALQAQPALRERLPARIHLFALAALPPLYLDLFRRLAEHLEVQLYALNPCRAYWGLIVRRRELALAATMGKADHLEVGNSLLASLGSHGRAMLDELAAIDVGTEAFAEPGRDTMLAHLQSDILELEENAGTHTARDDSLAIHVCHSATREVEVLHDRLLDLFARDATLTPSDVLVLVPEVDRYAPAIEAVFATAPRERRMPFSIADRSVAAAGIMRAFLRLLALAATRRDAESVLALLEAPAVGRRFGIRAAELPLAREWVRASGVRWGRDEHERAALGLPATREHTWKAGLDRLMLGYAMPGEGRHLFGGILPYDAVEGTSAMLAGRLKSFVEAALEIAAGLQRPRTMAAWAARLEQIATDFFDPDESEARELMELRAAVAHLAANATLAGAREAVPLAVVQRELVATAQQRARAQAFLGGGITFAALLPARAVPTRVVALLGLNDGVFPRQQRPPSFDLVARFPRKGDRISRDEDRYAFLEALLAARERLYLSYTGRSVRDNEPLPPSPVVAELIDAIRRAFGADALDAITVEHPLQPFSSRYFDGSRPELFSYAEAYAARRGHSIAPTPFLAAPLCEPAADEWSVITLEALTRFLRNPARHLLQERLGVILEESEDPVEPVEPFGLDGLELFALRRDTFARLIAGASAADALALARAAGALPHGVAGDGLLAQTVAELAPLVARARGLRAQPLVKFEAEFGAQRLVGAVHGPLHCYPAMLNPSPRLAAWVRHLASQLARGPCESVVYALDVTLRFAPLTDARDHLDTLLQLYRRGLCEPLPFFPKTSLAYVRCLLEKGPDAAQRAARAAWLGNDFKGMSGERAQDRYIELAFRHVEEPLGEAFAALACKVCEPMLAAGTEESP